MKFSVKFTNLDSPETSWWEEFDDPRVKDNRDAFAYGKVICEYWNSDLRQGEQERKVVNAHVTGPGKKRQYPLSKVDRNQLDLFHHRKIQ